MPASFRDRVAVWVARQRELRIQSEESVVPFEFQNLPPEVQLRILSFTDLVHHDAETSEVFYHVLHKKEGTLRPFQARRMGDISSLMRVSASMYPLAREVFFRNNHFQLDDTLSNCYRSLSQLSAIDLHNLRNLHICLHSACRDDQVQAWLGFLQHLHQTTNARNLRVKLYIEEHRFFSNPEIEQPITHRIPRRPDMHRQELMSFAQFKEWICHKATLPSFADLEVLSLNCNPWGWNSILHRVRGNDAPTSVAGRAKEQLRYVNPPANWFMYEEEYDEP